MYIYIERGIGRRFKEISRNNVMIADKVITGYNWELLVRLLRY